MRQGGNINVGRGVVTDFTFDLRTRPNGSATDPANWNDGSTANEWPSVTVLDAAGADVTDSVMHDLTGDDLGGYLKHPDPTTGLYRLSAATTKPGDKGRFGLRFKPDVALAPGTYTLEVAFDVGTSDRFKKRFTLGIGENRTGPDVTEADRCGVDIYLNGATVN